MALGDWNLVRGCPGWYYGLRIRGSGLTANTVTFDLYRNGDHAQILDLVASCYRTTGLARRMGERELRGYQHVAREAIRAFDS